MRIWLLTVGEPLPLLSGDARPWRTGLLAEELAGRGHEVVWWASRFDHIWKRPFECSGESLPVRDGLTLRFLDGVAYSKNISFRRLVNHWQIARDFELKCAQAALPDVILCSFPTIELSYRAVRNGSAHGIPVVLDVRDLWPDIFVQAVPETIRRLAGLALSPYAYLTRAAFRSANAIIGVSDGYLQWGLRKAGRARGASERVFPLGYRFAADNAGVSPRADTVRDRYGVPRDAVLSVFCGTLGRTYDLGPVIETAHRLSREGTQRFRFLICGDGERLAEWRARAEGNELIVFAGWLQQQEMHAVLRAADIGLAAYAQGAPQGVPNKIIEYVAAGLPIISSLTGESEQLIRQTECGVQYDPAVAGSFEDALRVLEFADIRAGMSERGRQLYLSRFEAGRVYAELADYLEVIGAERSRRVGSL